MDMNLRYAAFWLISCNWTAFNSFTVDASQTNALAKQDALFQKVSEAQKHTRSGHGSNLSAGGSHSNSPLLGGIGTGNSLRSHRSRSKRKSQVNVEKSSTKRLSITIATGIRPEVARSTKHYSGDRLMQPLTIDSILNDECFTLLQACLM